MRFEILGPLRVVLAERQEPICALANKPRVVLAALLWRANQPVPADELSEIVWDGRPPRGAAAALRALILRLRRLLGPDAGARILTRSPGYLIELSEDELDVYRFEALCQEAGSALRGRHWEQASAAATQALVLWRGAPLADIPSQVLRDTWVPHLDQHHVQVLEDRVEAELHLGHHKQLIPQLLDLATQHPLREHFHAQLMLALARAGRQAEALACYQQARRMLLEELGIEPGRELRTLHEGILAGDADLRRPSRGSVSPDLEPIAAPLPRQLPAAGQHFAGRHAELTTLFRLLDRTGGGNGMVVTVIVGAGGIGKTWLAVHWAHQHSDWFPDGQLFVDLRGFSPDAAPLDPVLAVRGFLDALGVSPSRIPADPQAQAALYRSVVSGKRMLILLDNAADAEQVVPLLPGGNTATVLITSRRTLARLLAREGAHQLVLDALSYHDAHALLVERVGRARAAEEPAAVAELAASCEGFPLALGIVSGRVQARVPLTELAAELRNHRLEALSDEDPTASLPAVLSWSYQALNAEQQTAFELLGVAPGPDIGLSAAASLISLPPPRTRTVLRALEDASLLHRQTKQRYTMHDLVRAYAATTAQQELKEDVRAAALRRVVDYYTHTADTGSRVLDSHTRPRRLDPPASGTYIDALRDVATATTWFDVERRNLLAAQHTASHYGWHSRVWNLAWASTPFYRRRGHRHDELAVWQAAVDAARYLSDSTTNIIAHRCLGRTCSDLGRPTEAISHLDQALALAEHHGNFADQGHTHIALASAWERRGDDRQAHCHALQALTVYRTLDQPLWEAIALNEVGWHAVRLGDYRAARDHCQAALTLNRQHHDADGESAALDSLGYIDHCTGHHQQAIYHYQQALALRRDLGNAYRAAGTLNRLGHSLVALGRIAQARTAWKEALEFYRVQGRAEDVERVQRQLNDLGGAGGQHRQ